MSTRFKHLPTTEEHAPTTDVEGIDVGPRLLGAFPKQIALKIPPTDEIVGRAWLDDNGIVDTKVSREHLSFSRKGGQLHITDHRSQNGTFVMGVQLEANKPTLIEDGAIIRIGQTIFVYREAIPVDAKPEPPLGELVAPWGLRKIRQDLFARAYRPELKLNVLLEGPTGTGKELLAKEVARRFRPGAKYIPVNLAAIPREHFESNLFGWEKNSFTGAFQANTGYLRAAAGGSVFLDEIEALPVELQPKLLRFLENRHVQPLGARDTPTVDCLVIAATNRSISELLTKDAFRRDVIARFQLRLTLPPLEDRPEDLYAILAAYWEVFHRQKLDMTTTRVDAEAIERLMRHDWPENVRELFRVVEELTPAVGIKKRVIDGILGPESEMSQSQGSALLSPETVANALQACAGNQTRAAKWLGVSRPQLLRWLKKNAKDT